jgi:hypothetical protein
MVKSFAMRKILAAVLLVVCLATPSYAQDCGEIDTELIRSDLAAGTIYPELMQAIILLLADYYDCIQGVNK